jgi:hypothetical protein
MDYYKKYMKYKNKYMNLLSQHGGELPVIYSLGFELQSSDLHTVIVHPISLPHDPTKSKGYACEYATGTHISKKNRIY